MKTNKIILSLVLTLTSFSALAHEFEDSMTFYQAHNYIVDAMDKQDQNCQAFYFDVVNLALFNFDPHDLEPKEINEDNRFYYEAGEYIPQVPSDSPFVLKYGSAVNGPLWNAYTSPVKMNYLSNTLRRIHGLQFSNEATNYNIGALEFTMSLDGKYYGEARQMGFKIPYAGINHGNPVMWFSRVTIGMIKQTYRGSIVSIGCSRL